MIRLALALAAIGLAICLWLLVGVSWYNFIAFMLVAQPLLVVAVLIFAGVLLRDLKRKGVF